MVSKTIGEVSITSVRAKIKSYEKEI
jgi:hypothetical protein